MAINFQIGFSADTKMLQSQLNLIQKEIQHAFSMPTAGKGMSDEIAAAVKQAKILENALKKATTEKGVSFISLNTELQKAGTSASQLVSTLAKAGPAFSNSLDSFLTTFATANRNLININSKIKEMQRVMTQSVKFTAAAQIQQFVASQISQAVNWVKELNSELNTIAIVSGKSASEMQQVFDSVIKNAKELRVAADDYAYAAQIFYQQGLGDEEVERRSQITIKAAQAAGQSTQEMSQQLTAVWNTYQMQGEQLERAASVGARMGAETAVEFKDIATAMQISASAASQMNVEYDMLAAIIATVGDTTQQSASVIGNAYKTIFSRFDQLVSSGTDGEVTLGRVSQQLADLGVQILDTNGDLIPLGETILDLGNRWEEYSQKQQIALAEAIGGTRQFGQVLALFNNWDKFMANYNSALSESGSETLEKQYLTSLDSLDSAMTNSAEAWSRAFSNIFEEDTLKGFYNGLEQVGNTIDVILDSIGGIPGILTIIGLYLSRNLLKYINNIKAAWNSWKDSLTLDNQLAAIRRDSEAMMNSVQSVHFRPANANNVTNAIANNAYDQQKLRITKDIALAQAEINAIEKTGTQEAKNKVEWLKQALNTNQQIAFESINNLRTSRTEAQVQEQIAKAMERRAIALQQAARKSGNGEDEETAKAMQAQAQLLQGLSQVEQGMSRIDSAAPQKMADGMMMMAKSVAQAVPGTSGLVKELEALSVQTSKQGLKGFIGNMMTLSPILDEISTAAQNAGMGNTRLGQSIAAYAQRIPEVIEQQQKLTAALKDTSNFSKQISAAFQLSGSSVQLFGQQLLQLASNTGLLVFQFMALGNALDQDEINWGAIIAQLLLMIPNIVATIIQFKTMAATLKTVRATMKGASKDTDELTKDYAELTAAITAATLAEQKYQAAVRSGKFSKGQLSGLKGASTKKWNAVGNMATSAGLDGTSIVSTGRSAAAQGATGAQVAQITGVGAAAAGASKGTTALGSSMAGAAASGSKLTGVVTKLGSALASAGPAGWIAAAAIVAVVAATAKLVYNFTEWRNVQPEAQLEKAKEAAQGLAEGAEEAKGRADELKSSIENYDQAITTLEDCERGTDEFAEALKNANEQALNLISTLSSLGISVAGLYERDADGLLKIDEDKLKQAQEQIDNEQYQADYAFAMGQANLTEAERRVEGRRIAKNINNVEGSLGNMGDTVASFLGLNGSEQVQEKIDEHLQSLMEATSPEDFKAALDNAGISFDGTAEELEQLQNDINLYGESINEASDQIKASSQIMADQMLGDEYSADDKDVVGDILAKQQEQYQDEFKKKMDDNFAKIGDLWGQGGAFKDEIIQAYRDYMNDQTIEADSNFARGTDTNREFAFKIDGEVKTVRAEELAAIMASQKALEGLGATADTVSERLNQLGRESVEGIGGEEFIDFLSSGNFNEMTEGEINTYSAYSDDQMETWLKELFNTDDLEQLAKDLGRESSEELIQDIRAGFDASTKDFDSIGKDLTRRAKQVFNNADLSDVSLNAQKEYAEMVKKVFTAGGSEGGEFLNDFIDQIGDNLTDDSIELDDVVKTLNNVDWSNITPEELTEKLKEMGVSTDDLTDKLPELIALMQEAAQVDFTSAQEHFKTIAEIAKINFGDTIPQEQYDSLSAKGKEYFQLMADGTYQLIGDAQEFKQLMSNEAMSQYNQLAMQNNERMAQTQYMADNADSYNFEELSKSQWGFQMANPLQGLIGPATLGPGSDNADVYKQLQYLEAAGYGDDHAEEMRNWQEGLEKDNLSIFEYQAIAQAIKDCGDLTDEWKNKTKELAEENEKIEAMQDATRIQGDMEESGLDYNDLSAYREGIEQLIETQDDAVTGEEEYSEALLENDNVMNEVAKEQARFTKGLQTAGDNLEDWKDIWDDNGTIKDYQKFSDSMDDMRSAYSDLLDVDGSSLSDDFLASAENMELLETVLTGSAEEAAEALNQLQENAIIELDLEGLDPTTISTYIQQMQDVLGNYGAGIEIPLNETQFYNALNAMIAACGTDMAKIEALCNNLNIEPLTAEDLIPAEGIGVDAEADTTTVEADGKDEQTSWSVQQTGTKTLNAEITSGSGEVTIESGTMATMSIPTWDYVPTKETEETKKEVPVTSYKLKPGTGVTKTSSGRQKVGNSTPPTPTNYRGGSTKPKTGGGGGGSGSAPKHSAKKASKYDPIKDRYATIKSSIDQVQRSVDALSDAQDDAWGAAKVRNLQKINSELQKQGKNLQQLRKLSLDYLKTDKRDAQIAAKDLITNLTKEGLPGLNLDQVLFNGEGFVSNRTELTAQLDNYLKSLYEPYYQAAMAYDRANSTNEAESERIDALKEKYDVAKAFVDEFLAALDLVDETAQEAADALEQQLENIREWMANKVEEATYKMEFQIGINERDISLIEQAIELWGDLGTMMGKTFDQLGKQLREEAENFNLTLEHGNRMIEIINNINPSNANRDWFIGEFGEEAWNKYITGNGGLPAEVLEAMQDDADSMIEYMNSMYDIAEEMFGQYIEVLNMYMDEFDKIADKISANNDKLEMFTELLEFSGKKWTSDGRDAIRSIADATVDNAQLEVERAASALELAKQGAEETTAQLEEFYAEHGRDAEGYNDTEAFVYNQLKAAKDEADALLADAQSDMTSSIQDLAAAAADAIEMVAEVIKDEVVENLGGDFASFDDMTSMYDQQYDLDTFFLRDFDKEYQLNSLLSDIDDQMENITDPGRLKEYEALIEEINAANQEGVDLTQTDVDLLKAKFEIQKAQDAYEEAQNAKNTMRLARDASGNWNYVYSSDQSETDNAAQALADAQYNYEKLLWEASDEASQYWLQAQQEFFQFQETIDWARYEHDADYKRMIDQQLAYYQQKTELYANQIVKYNGMLDVAFEDTTLGVITNCKDMNSAQEWYTTQHTKYTNDLKQNTKDYQGQVEETCNQVGIKYDELEETVKTETELMGKENDALREKIKNLNTEGSRALTKLDEKVRNFRESFIDHMEACQKKLEAFLNTLKQMENASINEMYNTGFDAGTDYTAKIHNYIGQKLEEGYTEEQLLADEELKSLVTELKNKLGSEELYYAGHGTVKDRWGQQGWDFVDKYLQSAVDEAMNYFLSGNFEIWDTVDEWVQNHPNWRELAQQNWGKPPETATGGLIRTPQIRSVAEDGAELILNSEDTKNILSAVAHMRDIVKMKMSSINGALGKKTSGVVDKTIINKDIQQVEQQVHIDATFPNVSVASEIEEAFSNLVNQAVQYVSQKNHQ